MPKVSKILSGQKAKANGKRFEAWVFNHLQALGWVVVRIPDGGKMISRTKFVRQRTPFDFVAMKNGKILCFDTKTVLTGNFTHSMLTSHQVDILFLIACEQIQAGYLIHLESKNKILFAGAHALKELERGESLNEAKHVILLGDLHSFSLDPIFEVAETLRPPRLVAP